MSLLQLRIRGRLYGGFGAIVLCGLALAGFAVWQLSEIGFQVSSMTAQSENAIRSVEISAQLHAARRGILRYTFDQDEPSFVEAEKRLASAGELIETAIRVTKLESRRETLRQVAKSVEDLKIQRATLGDAVKQMAEGRVTLRELGDKLASSLRKLVISTRNTTYGQGSATLESDTLLLQMATLRFFDSRDPKVLPVFNDKARASLQEISELEKMDMPPTLAALFGTIRSNLMAYSAQFEKTSASMLKADGIFNNSITPTLVSTIDTVEKVKTEIQQLHGRTSADVNQRIATTGTLQELVAGGVTMLGLLIAFLIARSIVRPLSGLTGGMKQLADGNFGVVLPGLTRKDEIGDMARAVEAFKIKAAEKAREEAEAKLTQDQQVALQRRRDMVKLADDFESAVGRIVDTVSSASSELESSAGVLTATAERSKQLTTMVSAASEQASTNVQSVASATEQMASSVNEISRQVHESTDIAHQAVEQASKTNDRVGELSKAAARIGAVVELINTIAGQTNLLALNATIEAARAGDAGRGFAVVASEVKALAEQTAKATGEISQQISGIQVATDQSVAAIREIGNTIGRMSEIASTIASAVEEQGAATQEISRNVQQAAQGTRQVSANIGDVQRGAGETGTASAQVLSAAQLLSSDSSRLKAEVGRFLESVRAA